MDGFSEIDAMIAKVEALGVAPEEVAKEAAPLVRDAVRATAKAGTSPYGEPWAAKQDGGRPLVNAASAVDCRASGASIEIRLVGIPTGDSKVQAIQNHRRPIIPNGARGLPKSVADAVTLAAQRVFERVTGSR
jgi:hypothetical protein